MDENGRILASKVTDGHEHDSSQVPSLLTQLDWVIDRFVGDRIYDQEVVYEAVDRHIAEIRSKGWSEWKRQSGYYLQSHAENAFYRYKKIIGGWLRAKNDDAQKREVAIGCAILNRMLEKGEPLSYAAG